MNLPIRLIRWFNHVAACDKLKHRLADWAGRRLPRDRGPQVYAGVQGRLKMRLDLASQPQRQMYLNSYQLVARRILGKVLRRGDVYVDCGAHLGYLSLWACRLVGSTGRVYAFEPMPPTVERLRENVRLNDVENIEVMANGTWDSPKTVTLHWFEDTDIESVSLGKREGQAVEQEHTIQTVRLDDVVDPPIRTIRIDVAGAELATLRGAEKLLAASGPHILMALDPVACESFGHQPIDVVNWLLKRLPDHRPRLMTGSKCPPINWQQLRDLRHGRPGERRDVWVSPA